MVAEILNFTFRMFEHEQIEASGRHCLLYAYFKKSFDININGNNSTTNYDDDNKKKLLGYTKTVDSVEIAL